MIYIENKELKFSDKKVILNKNGKQEENFVGSEGLEWWYDLESKHENIVILEVVDIDHTASEIERLKETKSFAASVDTVKEYIVTGDYSVFKEIEDDKVEKFILIKENLELKEAVNQLLLDSLM